MSRLDPEKLTVEFYEGVTLAEPIIPRRYTLTHSDITAELFLAIGPDYSYDKISGARDEVLGEWVNERGYYFYHAYLYVDGGEFSAEMAAIRNYIFRRELTLALEAIRYGDRLFFEDHKELDYSPIMVYFQSTMKRYDRIENWGTFSDYNIG